MAGDPIHSTVQKLNIVGFLFSQVHHSCSHFSADPFRMLFLRSQLKRATLVVYFACPVAVATFALDYLIGHCINRIDHGTMFFESSV